jgi:FtsP/CotA-like multicopper oxidase with cupredoxin domain
MTSSAKYSISTLLALFLFSVPPAGAAFKSQCPTIPPNGAVLGDLNGDGYIRADQGEIVDPVSGPNQVCVHMVAGDGFINMADKTLEPNGHEQYIFGFLNVTWDGTTPTTLAEADAAVGKMFDEPGGAMLGMTFPAPNLKFKQNDVVYLSLSNVGMVMRPDLFDPHSIHWHGFPNAAPVFDGEPMASAVINMGSTFTYYYNVVEPGTFIWHCHVEASEHMQMGMLGNLHVTPALGETFAYNDPATAFTVGQDYPLQISAFDPAFHDLHINVQPLPFANMEDTYPMLNGRGYPDTVNPNNLSNSMGFDAQRLPALITANQGDRILLRLSSVSTTSYHTIGTLGIPMQVVGTGARVLRGNGDPAGTSLFYTTNSITLGGGEAYDIILDTADVDPGTYFLYSTNLNHLNNNEEDFGGMMTEIVINGGAI